MIIPEEKAKATVACPKKPRATKRRGRHPDKALSAAFLPQRRRGRPLPRRQRPLPEGRSLESAPMGAAPGHPWQSRARWAWAASRSSRWPRRASRRSPTVNWRVRAATRSPRGAVGGHADLRGGRLRGVASETRRLAEREARQGLAGEPPAVRLPAHRRQTRLRGHVGRPAAGAHAPVARQARDRATRASTGRRRDEVGRRYGSSVRTTPQERRSARRSAANRTLSCWRPAIGRAVEIGSPQIGMGEPRTYGPVAVRENGATPSGVASSRASATFPLRFGPPGDATPAAVDGLDIAGSGASGQELTGARVRRRTC